MSKFEDLTIVRVFLQIIWDLKKALWRDIYPIILLFFEPHDTVTPNNAKILMSYFPLAFPWNSVLYFKALYVTCTFIFSLLIPTTYVYEIVNTASKRYITKEIELFLNQPFLDHSKKTQG